MSTAPEHIHNIGQVLDLDAIYPLPKQPLTDYADFDPALLPKGISVKDFSEIINVYPTLFDTSHARTIINKTAGAFISKSKANALVKSWRHNVYKQYENHRGVNSSKTILSLFDYSGVWSRPYLEAGYDVITFDLQTGQDVLDFCVEHFYENYKFRCIA